MGTPRIAILAAALAVFGGQLYGAGTKNGFRTDYQAARAHAAATGRPLLLHFYADYCPPCRRMEAEVFPDADLKQQMSGLVVAVKVNTGTEAGRQLAQQYGVNLIPHDRIVSPDGATELRQAGGFMSKEVYLTMLRDASARWAAMQPKPSKPAVSPKQPAVTAAPKAAVPEVVGLDGYCPVELSLNRKWAKGIPKFQVEYKGLKYQISSQANLDRFKAKPEVYAPQVLGCDPVELASSHRAIPGRTDFGAFFDGKLYLFRSKESRTTFKTNPLKYVRIQHALDASKIERTVVR